MPKFDTAFEWKSIALESRLETPVGEFVLEIRKGSGFIQQEEHSLDLTVRVIQEKETKTLPTLIFENSDHTIPRDHTQEDLDNIFDEMKTLALEEVQKFLSAKLENFEKTVGDLQSMVEK